MGGFPNKGTPADGRLRENKGSSSSSSGGSGGKSGKRTLPAGFTDKPWDGSASRWPDATSYAAASLINLNTGPKREWTKGAIHLPVKEPGGDYNRNGIHSAAAVLAGSMGGVKAPPAAKKAAARKLVALYGRMGETPPDALKKLAM